MTTAMTPTHRISSTACDANGDHSAFRGRFATMIQSSNDRVSTHALLVHMTIDELIAEDQRLAARRGECWACSTRDDVDEVYGIDEATGLPLYYTKADDIVAI